MSNTLTGKVSGKMSSRGWAIALGIGAIVLAAILLVVYLDRYRARVGGENAPTPVLVAKQLIPAGTPGTLIASQQMYAPTTLPRKEVESGNRRSPVPGRTSGIGPFFGRSSRPPISRRGRHPSTRRSPAHRAISVSIDSVHDLSQVQAGDSVDVRLRRRRREALPPERWVLESAGPSGGSNLIPPFGYGTLRVHHGRQRRSISCCPVIGAKPTSLTANAATVLR
jgi:hypothetical protein